MPDASFSHRAVADAPPETAWHRLQDPAVWANVTGIDSTDSHRHREGRLVGFSFTTVIGGISYRGDARVTAATPNEAMTLAVETKEVTGRIDVALRPNGSGTALDVAMVMRPAGLVGSFIFPVVRGAVSDGFGDSVERLAAALTDPRDQT